MTNPDLETLHLHPEIVARLHAQARHARAEYVHCLLKKFAALFARRSANFGLRTTPCA